MERSACSFSIQSKNVTISALLFLNSGWRGDVAKEWNALAELCGKTSPAWLLALLPDLELCGLFAENSPFELWDASGSGFVVPQQEGWKGSVYPLTLLPGWGIPYDPWPLGVARSDPCLLWPETLEQGLWLAGESPPHHQCFVLEAQKHEFPPRPPFFVFLLPFQFILWVPSMIYRKWEREL